MGRPNKLLLNLITELRNQVELCYKPGEAIPSQRELANSLGATQSSVHRALQALSHEQLVTPVTRVGWMRTPGAKINAAGAVTRSLRVGIISRRTPAGWKINELLLGLLNEAKRRGVTIVEVPILRRSTSTRSRARIELNRVPWNTFDLGLLAEIEEPLTLSDPVLKKHRVLSVDQDSTFFGVDSVALANWDAGALVARHLFNQGHRRFAVTEEVNEECWPCDPSLTARRQGFEYTLSWLGGLIRPEWRLSVQRAGFKKENLIRKAIAGWATKSDEQRPTALFAIDHGHLDETIPACAEHHIAIPEKLSVVTVCWKATDAQHGRMKFTHIAFDLGELLRRSFDTAAQVAADKKYFDAPRRKAFCVTVPGKLITGQSTRAIVARPYSSS